MNAFGWEVVGSVAGVLAVVVGILQFLQGRKKPSVPAVTGMPGQLTPGPPGAPADDQQPAAGDFPVVVGEIPQAPAGFQPRAALMGQLDRPPRDKHVSVVHAVTGMRGVGKTHVAAAYARARIAERWRLAAWVSAENSAAVLAGLSAVAVALGLDDGSGDAASAGRAVRHWLESGGHRCLLVFDNATDPEDLLPFLPAAGEAQVLITSNQQPMADLGAGVPVDVFTESEALAFLAGRTGSTDVDGARLLAGELGRLPLALAQAAAVIVAQRLDYPAYLRRLRDTPVDRLLLRVGGGQYPHGLAAAVLLSLDAAGAGDDTGACGTVMGLVSVLSAAGVPRALLHAAGQAGALPGRGQAGPCGADEVDQALGRLAGASLLTFSVDGTSVTAHRLVMRVIRERLARQEHLAETCQAATAALEVWAGSLPPVWRDRRAHRDLVEQITALDEHSARCRGEADADLTRAMMDLRDRAVGILLQLGDSAAQALNIALPLLAEHEQIHGPGHLDTVSACAAAAVAYQEAGQPAEAIPLGERALTGQEQILGPDHPHTMTTRNNLAGAYQDVGRGAEATALLERTVADRERILGPSHPDTLASRHNLAAIHRENGRTAEAIPLFERTVADREQLLGPDHPDTVQTRGGLAAAYRDTGRVAEAIPLFERTLAELERSFGPDHPYTLRTRNRLANAKAAQAQQTERSATAPSKRPP